MTQCARHETTIALHAGGDLAGGERRELEDHLARCSDCRLLLDELRGDLTSVTAALGPGRPEHEDPVFVREVFAQLGVAPAARPRRPAREAQWLRVAAAAVIVVVAGLLAVRDHGIFPLQVDGSTAEQTASEAREVAVGSESERLVSAVDGLPITVRRSGDALELSWAGDGREAWVGEENGGIASTYRVMASASPRDFQAGRTVEVAGNRIVATMTFPTLHVGGRDVTFFRVE